MPDMYEKLHQNYAGCDGLTFLNLAVSDHDGKIAMTRIDPTAITKGLLPEAVLGMSTTMPERGVINAPHHNQHFRQTLDQYKRTFDVPCSRLMPLLEQHNVTKLDLLVIDTEGADWIVAQQLSLEKYQPRAVLLEYIHLNGQEQIACANHFRKYGYKIYIQAESAENFLALR